MNSCGPERTGGNLYGLNRGEAAERLARSEDHKQSDWGDAFKKRFPSGPAARPEPLLQGPGAR